MTNLKEILIIKIAYKYLTNGPESFELSRVFYNSRVTRLLFVAYILTLGFQRLTYAFSDLSFLPWVLVVATHTVESYLWWELALSADYLKNTTLNDFILRILTFKSQEEIHLFILLLLVPTFVVIFTLVGPARRDASSSKKTK